MNESFLKAFITMRLNCYLTQNSVKTDANPRISLKNLVKIFPQSSV